MMHFLQFRLRASDTLSVRFQLFRGDVSSVLKRKKQGGSHLRVTDVSVLRFAFALASGQTRLRENDATRERLHIRNRFTVLAVPLRAAYDSKGNSMTSYDEVKI